MRYEMPPLAALKPYAGNARVHSKKQIKQIARSIDRFGFNNPILIDENYRILAGHGRYEAAKLLDLKLVPTIQLSHMSEADKRAYILADNRLAEKAGWDNEMLAIELDALIDLGFDLDLTGFEAPDVDLIIEGVGEGPDQADNEIPDLPKEPPVSRPGDLWTLGKHLLYCGDARDPESYKALMDGELAQFVLTDPPYNVRIDGPVSGHGQIKHREFAMASGEMDVPQFTAFLSDAFALMCKHSADGSIHEVFMDWRHMREMLVAGHANYAELKNLCVWNKSNAGLGSFYRSKHELIFVWKRGVEPNINNFELGQHGRHRTNVWDYEGVNTFRADRMDELKLHPTVKPVALVADAIRDCSKRGGIVLDPFCGSGTILIAAEKTGRRAFVMEIDPAYVDVAIRRWQAFTGKAAELAPLCDSFEEIEESRRLDAAE